MAVQKKVQKKASAAKETTAIKEASGAENKKDAVPKDAAKSVAKKRSSVSERAGSASKFLRGVQNELKKVHWPTRKEAITYTGVVLASVAVVAAVIWVLDSLLSLGVSAIIS